MTKETPQELSAFPLPQRVMRPGAGWRHLAGPVYEHKNGTRLHMLGLIKLPDGDFLYANKWPESKYAARFIRANGGNKRRGLMAWAMTYNKN